VPALGFGQGCGGLDLGERGVHEISTVVYVNAQFSVPVSHTLGCRVWRYKVRSQECTPRGPRPNQEPFAALEKAWSL
jgi:hypothetical protein